ncbi:MAG: recombinase XerC, partial [Erysipelotrichaceae bacterium]|nr:recombinase XerC [Erysipelotrichaceae bacterium]
MDKLLEDFLIYVDTSNSGSEYTKESYYRDIHRFMEYLNSEGVTDVKDTDRYVVMGYVSHL